jgi:hypothetical protein
MSLPSDNRKDVEILMGENINATSVWYVIDDHQPHHHQNVRISMSSASTFKESLEFLETKLKMRSAYLYDCTIYTVEDRIYSYSNRTDVAITSVRVEGLLPGIRSEWLCSGGTAQKITTRLENIVVVRGGPTVYVSGIESQSRNGSDALERLERILLHPELSSDMSLVTNCVFYVNSYENMKDLFQQFYNTFNLKYFPPPSRTEFTLDGKASFELLVKCVAATVDFFS